MKYFRVLTLVVIASTFCSAQTITTIAGNGEAGFAGDANAAVAAQLYFPYGLGMDATGNLYIGEHYNYRLRKVGADGLINTIAGTGNQGYSNDDSLATKADISLPSAITVDLSGNVYFADYGNARVRKIDANGVITTIAGTGVSGYSGDGGLATAAQINTPSGLAIDGAGNIYFTERNNNIVRKVDASGHISTIAGTGALGYSGDQGPATAAKFSLPHGIAIDGSGNIYIVDTGNNAIRKILSSTGDVITIAGTGTAGFSGDGAAANLALISQPHGIAIDAAGNIYFTDHGNNAIRKIDTSGNINTLAGANGRGFGGDEGPANKAGLAGPIGIAVTPAGVVYFVDAFNNRIRVIQ